VVSYCVAQCSGPARASYEPLMPDPQTGRGDIFAQAAGMSWRAAPYWQLRGGVNRRQALCRKPRPESELISLVGRSRMYQ
jgi:hypothetical protein